MPRAYFLLYHKDGRIGNDVTLTEPFKWLFDARKEYQGSQIVLERWQEMNIPQSDWGTWDAMFGIDVDEKMISESKKIKEKPAVKIKQVESEKPVETEEEKKERIKQNRVAALAKAREAKQKNKQVLGKDDVRK